MESSTLSSKYQIVIPKNVRKKLNLRPGQIINVSVGADNRVILETQASALDDLTKEFGGRKIWGDDPVSYIRKQRDEWDS